MRCFKGRPTTEDVLSLIEDVVEQEDVAPRFLISDHGSQFQRAFTQRCKALGAGHVRGRVGSWQLNAKVERFFRTMKTWQRRAWMVLSFKKVQSRLDAFRCWYNTHRPHAAHGRTPVEQLSQTELIKSVRFYAKGEREPEIKIACHKLEGDPLLRVLSIRVRAGPVAA